MSAFNKVMLMGNLTRDPQVKQLPTNTTVAEFGLAISRRFKSSTGEDREETCFVDCTVFGKQAELISQYCRKGKPLFVEGRLKYDAWDDKQGLGRRSKVSVVVENFQFLGGRDEAPAGFARESGIGSRTPGHESAGEETREPRTPRRRRPAEQPFGEQAMFQEADIPF